MNETENNKQQTQEEPVEDFSFEHLPLGKATLDRVTKTWGILSLMKIEWNKSRFYMFSPGKLSEETGLPSKSYWLPEPAISYTENKVPSSDLVTKCMKMLGTEAVDANTGFRGIVTSIDVFMNGCVHANLQSENLNPKTGDKLPEQNFDVRQLVGDFVPVFEEEQLEKSYDETPSPVMVSTARLC
jgi:hypothetical protein